ncbi:hypothetical protein GQX74_001694, partial [Glossina fuscipes]
MVCTANKVIAYNNNNGSQCILIGVYKTRQTRIMSPIYTNSYSGNTCWDYIVRSPYRCPTKFHIEFLDFFLPPSMDCDKDYLAIDSEDKLCGQVVGVRKYQTSDGVLRLRFVTNNSSCSEDKVFKLLITRLACETEDFINPFASETNTESALVTEPTLYLQPPFRERQEVFCPQDLYLPAKLSPETFDPTDGKAIFEPLSSSDANNACCVNPFHQRNFYLTSPGFPRSMFSTPGVALPRDCEYHFVKFAPNVCRLRLNLKFFNFGQGVVVNDVAVRKTCSDDFIEIDNQRFCGCLTGLTYESDWFSTAHKTLRMRMGCGSSLIGGFLIEVIQENCFENRVPNGFSNGVYDFNNNHPQSYPQLPFKPHREQPIIFDNPYPPSATFPSINRNAAQQYSSSNFKYYENCTKYICKDIIWPFTVTEGYSVAVSSVSGAPAVSVLISEPLYQMTQHIYTDMRTLPTYMPEEDFLFATNRKDNFISVNRSFVAPYAEQKDNDRTREDTYLKEE